MFPPLSVVDLWSTTLQEAKNIPGLIFVEKILNYELIYPTGAAVPRSQSGSAVGQFDFGLSWIFTGLFTPPPLDVPEIQHPWMVEKIN